MRAIVIDNFGGRERLQLAERPRPLPRQGQLLIRIKAAGVNPVDIKIREGLLRTRMPHQFPVIIGWDAAGLVEEVGPGCRHFKVGDEVYAYCRTDIIYHGTYAEYIAVDERSVALKPATLSFEEAASIPLAGLTAWQCLFDAAHLQRGQTVLIQAAAGGVGGFAVQLARQRRCRVIATASAKNHEYVRSLGAQEVIDYTQTDFVPAVRALCPDGVDVALDTVGGDVQERSAQTVKRGGTLVSILAYAHEAELRALGIDCKYVFVRAHGGQLKKIAKLAEAGKFRTRIAAAFPLQDAAKAHELQETRHVCGKIVLTVA